MARKREVAEQPEVAPEVSESKELAVESAPAADSRPQVEELSFPRVDRTIVVRRVKKQ